MSLSFVARGPKLVAASARAALAAALTVLTVLASGCAPSEDTYAGSLCQLAAEHVRECVGYSVDVGPTCAAERAQAVLDEPCSTFLRADKADFFGELLCGLGFHYRCATPTCPSAAGAPFSTECAAYSAETDCGSCEYYLCRDARRAEPCGARGYYRAFGYRYCMLFSERARPGLSARGQAWLDRARPCLQEALEAVGDDVTCDEVRERAYLDHPRCYIDSGFCELPITDMIAVLKTVAPTDLDLQALSTGAECLRRFFDPDTGALTDVGYAELEAQQSR